MPVRIPYKPLDRDSAAYDDGQGFWDNGSAAGGVVVYVGPGEMLRCDPPPPGQTTAVRGRYVKLFFADSQHDSQQRNWLTKNACILTWQTQIQNPTSDFFNLKNVAKILFGHRAT